MKKTKTSIDSLAEATRGRAQFSGHRGSLGAAGYREVSSHPDNCEFLNEPGATIAVSPGPEGFKTIDIAVAWDNIQIAQEKNFFGKLFKKARNVGVDLDLGCLYELRDGTRGAIQAFGEKFGSFEQPPYMKLSGDERTGDADGQDEVIHVNGVHWDEIKRVLVYIYIYEGAPRWSEINPQIIVDVPGEDDLIVTLGAHDDALALCAVGGLESVRGGIKLTNYTEYFPGHYEMDRAFGFGLEWGDGQKE
ncbi:MAG: Tellurium resistance protein TerA [Rhodospirillales bacterium]|nr:Tellurium resistance protein TerA [Rhodospirillales bacterium]